ncbi:MAG: dicarboxylate/amino acid:cation symporter, partial [Fimbriimonadales bacterium]
GTERAKPVLGIFESLNHAVAAMVGWVMRLAPVGIFALVAHTVATQEVSFLAPLLKSLGLFATTVAAGLMAHFVLQLALLRFVARCEVVDYLKRMAPALATAFGTNSSNATLPVTMRCADEMGVPRRISSFVLPVGATLNMDGTALFEAAAAMFFAQAFGFDFGLGTQILIALTSVLAAMGAAGIPSAGLVTMVLVLSAVGLPTTKLPLLWAIDRPLDMLRTVVNVNGDALTCRILERLNPDLEEDRPSREIG